MTYFGPTRGDMKFRLTVSLTGLILLVVAVALRGLPGETQDGCVAGRRRRSAYAQLVALALVFLIASAWISARGLGRLKDD